MPPPLGDLIVGGAVMFEVKYAFAIMFAVCIRGMYRWRLFALKRPLPAFPVLGPSILILVVLLLVAFILWATCQNL